MLRSVCNRCGVTAQTEKAEGWEHLSAKIDLCPECSIKFRNFMVFNIEEWGKEEWRKIPQKVKNMLNVNPQFSVSKDAFYFKEHLFTPSGVKKAIEYTLDLQDLIDKRNKE